MSKDQDTTADIKETDIVFDCPHCGKSLAIDYRGAGLTIKCSDCGKDVQVPIPEGMELEDIDSSNEEQEIRIMHLRKSLVAAQERVHDLESTVRELTARRETLEKGRSESMDKLGKVLERVAVLDTALKNAVGALQGITTICKPEGEQS